ELGPELGDMAAAEVGVERAPADAVARLDDDHRVPGGDEAPRGGEARETGPDDRDVGAAGAPARLARAGGGRGVGAGREERGARDSAADELAAGEVLIGHGARDYVTGRSVRDAVTASRRSRRRARP